MEAGLLLPVLGRVADVRYPLVILGKGFKKFPVRERHEAVFKYRNG